MVSPEQRLTPSDGPLRRRVVQIASIAVGCAEKAQWAFYEDRVRPAEKVHAPWIEHNDEQVLGGFEHLNVAAAKIDENGWIAGTPDISQADVTTPSHLLLPALPDPTWSWRSDFPGWRVLPSAVRPYRHS